MRGLATPSRKLHCSLIIVTCVLENLIPALLEEAQNDRYTDTTMSVALTTNVFYYFIASRNLDNSCIACDKSGIECQLNLMGLTVN